MNNIYDEIISFENLILAWKKARKGKTKKDYVIEFEKELFYNLMALHYELKYLTYFPKPLKTFVLRDPKTRVISKSYFRDRIIHHAIVNILEVIFCKRFIYDSCANQLGKGTLFALKRFEKFQRMVTKNYTRHAFCLKADIKHYFQEVNHNILLSIIKKKVSDIKTISLIEKINANSERRERERLTSWLESQDKKGMPLGNLTSQFFANIYLTELDYFIKHKLKVKYYIRYVDDFVILHQSREHLEILKKEINKFLKERLKIELHSQKSRIISLLEGVDFVGFRNFSHQRLLRKRNIRTMRRKIMFFKEGTYDFKSIAEIYQGWQAYAKWGNTFKLRNKIKMEIINAIWDRV